MKRIENKIYYILTLGTLFAIIVFMILMIAFTKCSLLLTIFAAIIVVIQIIKMICWFKSDRKMDISIIVDEFVFSVFIIFTFFFLSKIK